MTQQLQPRLFGLEHSSRKAKDHFGKNQFNSSFPASLAAYMRQTGGKAVYLRLDSDLKVVPEEISIDDVFGVQASDTVFFDFETKFESFQKYSHNELGGIDLVVGKIVDGQKLQTRPLEVKLTVIPDSYTCDRLSQADWGSELVIRPATTKYTALSIRDSIEARKTEAEEILESVCNSIQTWSNNTEILAKKTQLLDALDTFQSTFLEVQKPMLIQPIWKTKGKTPALDDNCFDLFVWSDFALCRPFLDRSRLEGEVSRLMRASARLCRVLYELSRARKVRLNDIYTDMALGFQTDKEFALNGAITNSYMRCDRLTTPKYKRTVLNELLLDGAEKLLSPERRFDASVFFTANDLFVQSETSIN